VVLGSQRGEEDAEAAQVGAATAVADMAIGPDGVMRGAVDAEAREHHRRRLVQRHHPGQLPVGARSVRPRPHTPIQIDTRRAPADHGQLLISGTCVPQQLRNAGMGRHWARQVSPQPSGGLVVLVAQRGEVVHPGQAHDVPPRMLMTLGRLPVRALHLFGVAGAALQEPVPEARRRPRARGVPRSGQVLLPTDVLCPPAG
jgi:hypothetical protein